MSNAHSTVLWGSNAIKFRLARDRAPRSRPPTHKNPAKLHPIARPKPSQKSIQSMREKLVKIAVFSRT
jgi:hypothetical protein